MSGWMRVLSRVPQGSVLDALLFLVYNNDLDSGIVNKLLKFADDTKIFGRVEDEIDGDRLQTDLDTIMNRSDKWRMEFNIKKCYLMHTDRGNRNLDYVLWEEVNYR